jgi:hypothetical protein
VSLIRFRVQDAAEVRFAVSPLWETLRSLYALHDPVRFFVHRRWVDEAKVVASMPDVRPHVERLHAVARPKSWLPDFLTPAPSGAGASLEDELEQMMATEPR